MARRLIHELNRRYREQWQRAELLQRELGRRSWLAPFRWLARAVWRAVVPFTEPAAVSGPVEFIEPTATPRGTVSVVIPFRDRWELLRNCLRSLRRTSYPGVEVVLVDNGSECPRLRRKLRRWEAEGRYRVVRDPLPFNFSRLCNLGARAASGEWLLFLNNDTEVVSPGWLEAMLAVVGREEVGVTGAALYYPDGTLQHIGLCQDTAGRWIHPHRGMARRDVARHPELSRARRVDAVTGACLLVGRERFWELGGFDESLPVTHNDVDLCLRAQRRGWKVALAPEARLLHYEGMSRGCEDVPASVDGTA